MTVPGYTLNELILESQGKDFSIYRATKVGVSQKYLLKIIKGKLRLNGGGPGESETKRDDNEVETEERERLGRDHHLRFITSFSCEDGECCVYDDEPVQSLNSLGELSIRKFVRIAESLAHLLADFHSRNISLPLFSRDSFLFNKRTSQIRLVHLDIYKPSSSPADLEGDLKRLGQVYIELIAPSQGTDNDPLARLNSAPELKKVLSSLLNTSSYKTVNSLIQDLRPLNEDNRIRTNLEFDSHWLTDSISVLQRQCLSEESVANTAVSLVLRNGIVRAYLLAAKKTPSYVSFSFLSDSGKRNKDKCLSLSLEKKISIVAKECFSSGKPTFSSEYISSLISSTENGNLQKEREGLGYPFFGRERQGVLYLEGPKNSLHSVSQSPLFIAFVSFLSVLLDNAALAAKTTETTTTDLVESAADPPDSVSLWGQFYTNLSKQLEKLVIPAITPSNESKLNVLVENLEQWDFDIFEFDRLCEGRSLYYMSCVLFKKHNLVKHFNIEERKLKNFMQLIDDGYRENPYHNSLHAADVAQTIHYYLTTGGISTHLTEADILSMLVAAIIHDYKHPGLTNKFLIDTTDPISIIYNDVSVLENFHLAESFAYLLNEDTNILLGMPPQQKQEIRKSIIQTVLSTDLANHVSIIAQFNEKTAQGGVSSDRQLLLKMFIKSADISHPVKPNSLHREWSSRLIEEFYLQGEKESQQGLPISTFMDRKNPAVSTCQLGFIHFFVEPLFKATYSILSPEAQQTMSKFLNENVKYWKEEQSKEDQLMKVNKN